MAMTNNLMEQTVLISGGLGGIGKAIALHLSRNGSKIILLDRAVSPEGIDFVSSLTGSGHVAIECDLTNELEVKVCLDGLMKTYHQIDVCIHTAVSPLIRKKASQISPSDFRQQFEVSLFGGLNLFQAVIPGMKAIKKGKLIGLTTAALASEGPESNMSGYLCAKFALKGLLKELSKELVSSNIAVNAMAPDFVPTYLHKDLPEQVVSFISSRMPTNTPDDVAKTAALLCAEDNAVTGFTFLVSSGERVKL